MPSMLMEHSFDPKKLILDKVGSLKGFKLFGGQVLIGMYVRSDKQNLASISRMPR